MEFIDFPPLYTLQPNLESRSKQFRIWFDIIKFNRIKFIGVNEVPPLFSNSKINRKLNREFILSLCDYLLREGYGEYRTPNRGEFLVYDKPLPDWATEIHRAVDARGGGIESVVGLGNEFNLEIKLILKIFEKYPNCEIIQSDNGIEFSGIKFFPII